MSTITVVNHVTLDGVMQAPGRPGEDERGGFDQGGWAQAGNDPVMGRVMGEGMAREGALLLGRRTYEDFAGFWPRQTDNPFTERLNATRKYVATRSSTLSEPIWANTTLLQGDAADAVADLKRDSGQDMTILGSGELIGSLMERRLIDRWTLMIHPRVLGTGRRLFAHNIPAALKLRESVTTTTGVIIATYETADD